MKKTLKNVVSFSFILGCCALFAALISSCTTNSDTESPTFNNLVNGEIEPMNVEINSTKNDFLTGVTAKDNIDTKVTITVDTSALKTNEYGTYTITYTATDDSGNMAKVTRKVTVVDTTAPLFDFAQDGVIPAANDTLQYVDVDLLEYEKETLKVFDNSGEELTVTVKDTGNFNKDVCGTYTITYSVKDSHDNEATATRDITVTEAIKYVADVIKIGDEKQPAVFNNEEAFAPDKNGVATLKSNTEVQVMTKEFYLSQVTKYASSYASNGGVALLNDCVVAVFDKDYKPVLVRNANYATETFINDSGEWQVLKNGNYIDPVDGHYIPVKTRFLDGTTPNTNKVGILGGDFETYIPDGGYVVIGSSCKSNGVAVSRGFVIRNLLVPGYQDGALTWDKVVEKCAEILPTVTFSFIEDDTSIYAKPAAMAAPTVTVENHVLSWNAVDGAKCYEIYANDELIQTVTTTSVKTLDLGLTPSAEGEHYDLQVKAITCDIRFFGDSEKSVAVEYVMPNAEELVMGAVTITDGVASWEAVTGAVKYEVYYEEVLGTKVKLVEVTTPSYDLSCDKVINGLAYAENIYVKAIGDGIDYVNSDYSTAVLFNCSVAKVISFGDGAKYPVIETTALDYFSRRNDASAIGYGSKNYLYVITDPENIDFDSYNEAFGFVMVLDSNGNVKDMINIVTTTKQLIDGAWVDAATCGYANNSAQIAPLKNANIVEGDTMIIGRHTDKHDFGAVTGKPGRDLLANYYWSPATTAPTASWKSEHTIEEYPTYTISLADNQLAAPELTANGSVISWDAVKNATSYVVYVNGELVVTQVETQFDLLDFVDSVGSTGPSGTNASAYQVKVVAKAENFLDGVALTDVTMKAEITDGTTTLNVNYNVKRSLYNDGSGILCRGNDATSTLLDGKTYKEAFEQYKESSNKNAGTPWMSNGTIVVLDKDFKVKKIRFSFIQLVEISASNTYLTNELTWNNGGQNATTPAGNFLNLEKEIEDTDYVLIVINRGVKVQLTAATNMFVDTNTAEIFAKNYFPSAESTTKVVVAEKNYQLKFTATIE